MMDIKSIWVFDTNHRVYEDDDGNRISSPNYRHYWQEKKVISETTRSWILSNGFKIPKNPTKQSYGVAFSKEEVERRVWIHNNQFKIAEQIRVIRDYDKLKRISDIIHE